jgi:hypothetical protein
LKKKIKSLIPLRAAGSRKIQATTFLLALIYSALGFYWGIEPKMPLKRAELETLSAQIVGLETVSASIDIAETVLSKSGGYLYNDAFPPGAFMDNIPNWELGALVQLRDMVRTLRNNMSRSQSQSTENLNLVNAEGLFYFDNNSWILPSTEGEYKKGVKELLTYLNQLKDLEDQNTQFYARADNLTIWLSEVETRLGSLSQRLSASVGKRQLDVALAGDSAARQSTEATVEKTLKTPWLKIDDIFYEARGTTWALIHLLKAIETDFSEVLQKKNALISLQQIIRELEPTQDTVWSPMILNGSGLGFLANHSLVMGSHISRANAAIIDLRRLLEDG